MNERVNSSAGTSARILLVEDHPVFTEGLIAIIEQEPDLVVCGAATSAAEARRKVAELRPNLCILDITLEDANGIDLTKAGLKTVEQVAGENTTNYVLKR